jgi:hypothetical protein
MGHPRHGIVVWRSWINNVLDLWSPERTWVRIHSCYRTYNLAGLQACAVIRHMYKICLLTKIPFLCDIEANPTGAAPADERPDKKAWLMGKPETACTPVVSGLPFGSQVTAASDEPECVLKRDAFLRNTSSSDRWPWCARRPKAAEQIAIGQKSC